MIFQILSSREKGIRTLDMLPYTRFPSVRLQPLDHLSILRLQITLNFIYSTTFKFKVLQLILHMLR